jgi:lactoylglutathione lyase
MTSRLEHVALWTLEPDRLVAFFVTYFGAQPGPLYRNADKGFESRFVQLGSGARIEVMRTTLLDPHELPAGAQRMGLTHVAIAVGTERDVDRLTERLRRDGYPVLDGPRRTGDGYYESVVLDPDGNRLEIIAG